MLKLEIEVIPDSSHDDVASVHVLSGIVEGGPVPNMRTLTIYSPYTA